MTKNVHKLLKIQYEKKQKDSFDLLIKRKHEIYAIIPEIERIDSKIHFLGLEYNKTILSNNPDPNQTLAELENAIDTLKAEKISLLKQHGFPENYLSDVYQCTKCKDTGFVEELSEQIKCSCYKQALINLLYNQANLSLLETENFNRFNENYYSSESNKEKYGADISPRDNILLIKEKCLKFINNFDSPEEKNLFFSGPTGVGKTFISNCIAREILNKGKTVIYQTAPRLFDIISEYKLKAFKNDEFEDSNYKNIFQVQLLIIDDLGTESLTSSRYAELLNILNTRQSNNILSPCKTIISTNLGPRELREFYTERVLSRVAGYFDTIKFFGNDIRLR